MSNQLRDFLAYAKQNGYRVVLQVANVKNVSAALRKEVEHLGGSIEPIATK